jgi:DNA-binding LacI/PurR family transcriptional regulator
MYVTLREIAKRASVSQTTASLILKGGADSSRFSPETAKRVREIAAEMGYRTNRTAAILRNQKNCLIGVLSGGYRMEYFGAMLEGISNVVEPKYGIVPAIHHYSGEIERHNLQMFIDMRLSGIIAFWSGDEKSIPLYREVIDRYGILLILCDSPIPGIEVPCLAANDERLAYMASTALLEAGHKNILGLIFQQQHESKTQALITGYRKAMSEYNLVNADFMTAPFEVVPIYSKGYADLISLYVDESVKKIEQAKRKYTSVWTQDDLIAYDLIFKLNKAGLKVPEDISVIGMGNRQSSSLPQINLSSVASESFVDNGVLLSRTLINMIDGQKLQFLSLERKLKVFLRGSIRKS